MSRAEAVALGLLQLGRNGALGAAALGLVCTTCLRELPCGLAQQLHQACHAKARHWSCTKCSTGAP